MVAFISVNTWIYQSNDVSTVSTPSVTTFHCFSSDLLGPSLLGGIGAGTNLHLIQ